MAVGAGIHPLPKIMATSPLAVARLMGAFTESLTYGIYIVTCFSCWSTLLLKTTHRPRVKWVKAIVAAVLFIIATVHLGLNYYRMIVAFASVEGVGDSTMALIDIASWDNILSSVLVVLQCTIGDAIPIYRCFIVYNRCWKVVIPSILLYIGGCVCTGYFMYLQATLRGNLINAKKLVPLGTAFWAVTVVQNTISTALLVYRIWRVSHEFGRLGNGVAQNHSPTNRLDAAMKVIAASGFLYTFTALLTFIAEVCGSVLGFPLSDIAVTIVGIAFNLIITRSSHIFHEENTTQRSGAPSSIPFPALSKRTTFISNVSSRNPEIIQPTDSAHSFPLSVRSRDTVLFRSNVYSEDDAATMPSPVSEHTVVETDGYYTV